MLQKVKKSLILQPKERKDWFKEGVQAFIDSHKNQWLSNLVKARKKEMCKPYSLFENIKVNLYTPSLKSFILILLLFGIIFILSHFVNQILGFIPEKYSSIIPALSTIGQESNHYQNLIAILAGIGGVVFALIIFIAESFRDRSADRGRVLLRESYIWPLTVSVMLSFLLLLWGDVNTTFLFLPITALAIFTIFSLSKIIITLLSQHTFVEKRVLLLKELMQKSIKFAIDERIADNILLSKLDGKEINLQFYPFSTNNKENLVCFNESKLGIIKDINLKKLKEFATRLDNEAIKNKYAFEERQEKTSDDFSTKPAESSSSEQQTLEKNNTRYLVRKYNDVVDEKHTTLICFDSRLVNNNTRVISELKNIFNQIFIIERQNSFTEEVRFELSNIKDRFTTAIKESKASEVEELSKTYVSLAEAFLEQVLRCGGGYNFEQARKERTSLFSGWQELQWLSSDLGGLIEQVVKSDSTNIAASVVYTPIAIAQKAIEKHDHYLFQEFIRLSEVVYLFTRRSENEHVKNFLTERVWMHLRELCKFYIEFSIRKNNLSVEEIRSYKDFSIHLLFIFQNLMKLALEENDFDSFHQFRHIAQKLFENKPYDRKFGEIRNIEHQLERDKLNKIEKNNLNKKLEIAKEKEVFWKEILERRQQMLFGLASFIFNKYQRSSNNEHIRRFFNDIHNSLPNDIVQLTKIFQESHSFETEDFWGWGWWDIKPDEGVQTMQILEKLEKLYAIKSLIILSSKNSEEINRIELPISRDFAFLAEGTRDLLKILNDIKEHSEKWNFVLNSKSVEKVDDLKKLIENVRIRQEQADLEKKRKRAPSSKKITEFKSEVISTYNEYEHVPTLFKHFGLYKDKLSDKHDPKDKTRFGVNTVDDKAAFFDNWHIHYGNWGENYGRNIASGVNSEILDELTEKAEEIESSNFEQKIKELGKLEEIVILGTSINIIQFFEESEKFSSIFHHDTPQLDVKGFYGWYKIDEKRIPIFKIQHNNSEEHIFILNKKKLGTFLQQSPLNEGEDVEKLENIFYFNIKAFSENTPLIDEFISKPPEWLTEIGNKEEQRLHLTEKILIQIYLRFTVQWSKDFKAYKFKINDDF